MALVLVEEISRGTLVDVETVVGEWLRPQAIEDRQYQRKIMETVRQKNTLVVLPTALGKTVIALLLAIERTKLGKILFLAPTRPLVQQHQQTFKGKTLFENEDLIIVTGKSPPEKRKALYKTGRIIFATPQCVRNDVKNKLITLKDVSLIVFDEAHRAKGNYAYTIIANYYFWQCSKPLVLGLTASPGGYEEKIVEVCRNLGIQAIENRTDEDQDVKPYIHPITLEWKRVKPPQVYLQVRNKLREMTRKRVKTLQSFGVLSGKRPAYINRRDLVELNQELHRRIGSGEGGFLFQLKVTTTAALSIMHMIELIETQGPDILQAYIKKSLERMAFEGSRGHKLIVKDSLFIQAKQKLKQCLQVENPKMTKLAEILTMQLETKTRSRFIVFTQYRDTVKAIMRKLKDHPSIRAKRFVGQGSRADDPGMTQDQQHESLEELRSGKINVLVATSIAEEGLDIPEVDHVVFYEPVPSEVRYIQRRGRTGRKVAGKVSVLIAEGTLDEAYYWASIRRAKKMKQIIKELNRKLPETSTERPPPSFTREQPSLTRQLRTSSHGTASKQSNLCPERVQKLELWMPQAFRTKGLTPALKWLVENLPGEPTPITQLVGKAFKEAHIERMTMETAIWRLVQQGQLYQPKPGLVMRL